MSAYESGARKAIPAVLVYARVSDQILMIHRGGREGDYHAGRWNGLGGKLEPGESPLEAARRELREESGLSLPEESFRPLGALTFPNFKAHVNEDWLVYVFLADVPFGLRDSVRAPAQDPEGQLHWVRSDQVPSLNLWPGDRFFIQHVIEEQPFFGTIWYQGAIVTRHWIQPVQG